MKPESSFINKKRDTLERQEKIVKKKYYRRRPIKHRALPRMPTVQKLYDVCSDVSTPTMVQKLYDVCSDVFKGTGTIPPSHDVMKLQLVLDEIKPEDVGLRSDLLFFKPKSIAKETPTVTYTTIYQCAKFSLCIFFLPQSAVLPLHNHPGMTVFSKLLVGSMHIKAYDWVDAESENFKPSSKLRLARLELDKVFTAPCNASILYPSAGGNIHAFTAVTPCAVLDVLGPPYSQKEDRDCTYYRDFPCSGFLDDILEAKEGSRTYSRLEEMEKPKDLKMDGVGYWGPPIVERC